PPPPPPGPGQLAWRYPPVETSASGDAPLRGCPAVDSQGRVFVCSQHQLVMFPAGSPSPRWKYSTAGLIPRSPAIGPDGNVRVHSNDGCLHVVDLEGQAVFKPVAVGGPLGWASPLVDQQNQTWICRHDGGLIRVGPSGATEARPFFRTRYRFDCTGLIVEDTLYIGCENHYVYAIPLHGEAGENKWAGSVALGRTGCSIHCPLALADGPELLVVSQDDRLYGFGLDGQSHWAVALPGKMLCAPVVDDQGTIYAGLAQNPRDQAARGVLFAINGATHQIKWQYATAAPLECTPVIGDDGIVYVGDNDGTVHAVDARGQRVWTTELRSAIRSAGVIIQPERVAFGLDDGSLAVLLCTSQRVAAKGWPKAHGTLGQSGWTPASGG
ncbi:MAG: PQQ-binding-like beta-propeller repeat protein, partial [Planctomycetota bacterium]|nr:PQQ-binding-like beta-propeller repeat protein [Planctomycetota bacterium]